MRRGYLSDKVEFVALLQNPKVMQIIVSKELTKQHNGVPQRGAQTVGMRLKVLNAEGIDFYRLPLAEITTDFTKQKQAYLSDLSTMELVHYKKGSEVDLNIPEMVANLFDVRFCGVVGSEKQDYKVVLGIEGCRGDFGDLEFNKDNILKFSSEFTNKDSKGNVVAYVKPVTTKLVGGKLSYGLFSVKQVGISVFKKIDKKNYEAVSTIKNDFSLIMNLPVTASKKVKKKKKHEVTLDEVLGKLTDLKDGVYRF